MEIQNVMFLKEIHVPDWKYCNEGNYYDLCDFAIKFGDGLICVLFNDVLYTDDFYVKKCEKCLERSNRVLPGGQKKMGED
jgi:hypothetical protein